MHRRDSRLMLAMVFIVLCQLTGCKTIRQSNKSRGGLYLTNSTYYGWKVGSVWLDSGEHLYSLSDSLVVHSFISQKGIINREFEISKVERRGKHADVYFASNINAAFVFHKKNRSIKVFEYNMKLNALKPIPSEMHFGMVLVEKFNSPSNESADHLISKGAVIP